MSEESSEADSVPGRGAGDSAPTRAVPRTSKPAKTPPAAKRPGGAPTPAKKSSTTQTDKGRVRDTPPPVTKKASGSASKSTKPVADAERKHSVDPIAGPADRPLSAGEYARTTASSPASTSVMPAVRDSPPAELSPAPSDGGSTRHASLRLVRVEPWSVTRLAFAISVAMMIVGVVAVTIFWLVLDIAGVWGQVNDSVTSILSDDSSSFDITDYLGFGRMVGLTLVLSAINVILMTALATIGAHLYNLAAQLLGGVEVTFAEED